MHLWVWWPMPTFQRIVAAGRAMRTSCKQSIALIAEGKKSCGMVWIALLLHMLSVSSILKCALT